MAVTKTVYPVNGGNTGWSRSDVISAMETAFAGLGWHGGTAKPGVPTTTYAPGQTTLPYWAGGNNDSTNWRYASQPITSPNSRAQRYFNVVNSGSSSYDWERKWRNDIYFYPDSSSTNPSWVRLYDHELATGDSIVWQGTSVPELTQGQTYYAISVGEEDWIQLATSSVNASSGVRISFSTTYNFGTQDVQYWTKPLGSNPTITCRQGDTLWVDVNASGHPFHLQDQSGPYNVSRVVNNNNYVSHTYRSFPSNNGIEVGQWSWLIDGWNQGDYYYVCQIHSAMNGIIRVLPSVNASFSSVDMFPYWDYTVSGASVGPGRTDLQLRIRRQGEINGNAGYITSIEIINEAEGWSAGDTFTIPGTSIGGTSPSHDIRFGVNSKTTQQQNDRTGVASIAVTNIGAQSNGGFFQKFTNTSTPGAILKIVSDAGKTYGTTYFGFRIDNDYQMHMGAGSDWKYMGWDSSVSSMIYNGRFGGESGMDYPNSFGTFEGGEMSMDNSNTYFTEWDFTTSSTPTSYPLKIVTYQAQAPQDTNFAVISFVYTINSVDYAALTWSPLKGTNIGNGVWDLDNVWNGCSLHYTLPGGEAIGLRLEAPVERYYSDEGYASSDYKVAREAFYGYLRDSTSDSANYWEDVYVNNLFGFVGDNQLYISGYYRNNAYDKYTVNFQNTTLDNKNDAVVDYEVSAGANYYRPFKGLPLNHNMMPCPYYLPDDFTMIHFAVTPGATAFRVGDTITVSASEIYEIVRVAYTTNQTAFDGVANNTSKGIAFCARTT